MQRLRYKLLGCVWEPSIIKKFNSPQHVEQGYVAIFLTDRVQAPRQFWEFTLDTLCGTRETKRDQNHRLK